MSVGIKVNLRSIVQFLENPDSAGMTRDELALEARAGLDELRRRQRVQRSDKGGGEIVNPEAIKAVPVVEALLRHLQNGEDEKARVEANTALEILRTWF